MRIPARAFALPAAAMLGIAAGVVLRIAGAVDAAHVTWMTVLILTGLPVVWRTVYQATKGHFATDLVATLAIVTAVLLRQPVAGLVIVLMQTGGEALERYAEGRASGAIRALSRRRRQWRGGCATAARRKCARRTWPSASSCCSGPASCSRATRWWRTATRRSMSPGSPANQCRCAPDPAQRS